MEGELKKRLDEADESVGSKYLDILQSLSLNELKKFNKQRHKELVITDLTELVREADRKNIDIAVQYVSNMLNNEAQCMKTSIRTQNTRHKTKGQELVVKRDKHGLNPVPHPQKYQTSRRTESQMKIVVS